LLGAPGVKAVTFDQLGKSNDWVRRSKPKRFHPIETLWRFVFIVVPTWLLGLPVQAVALYRTVSAFIALFEHMNVKVWQPLDTTLSFVIGTRHMHKLHHSRVPTETNTNYGNILSLFDRVLGTLTSTARANSVDCGLEGYDDADTQRIGGLLGLPFALDALDAALRKYSRNT